MGICVVKMSYSIITTITTILILKNKALFIKTLKNRLYTWYKIGIYNVTYENNKKKYIA